jgi:murein DD-endopeptidase MepM/ murein hydrolase activator NlpD
VTTLLAVGSWRLSEKFLWVFLLLGFSSPAVAQIVEGNEALSSMDPVDIQVAPELQLPAQPPLPLKLNGKAAAVLPTAPQVPPRTATLPTTEKSPRKRLRRKRSTSSPNRLKAPLDGRPMVTQKFGLQGNKFSRGIDFANVSGNQVRSTDGGLVLYAGSFPNIGNIVVIGHGSKRRSRYLYLSEIAVKTGDQVSQGAILGRAGSAPLHFEYWLKVSGATWRAQDAAALLKL